MIKVISYTPSIGNIVTSTNSDLLHSWNSSDDNIIWVQVIGKEIKDTNLLYENFSFNSLAVADSLRDRHPPKIEIFDNYKFLILRPIKRLDHTICGFTQLSLFIGDRFVITRCFESIEALNQTWKAYENEKFDQSRKVNHIVYQIFRKIADEYLQVIHLVEDKLEEIEDLLDKDESDTLLTDLTNYNTLLRKIARNLDYMERVAKQYHDQEPADNKQSFHEFIDVYEQLERGHSLANLYQALCTDLINAHISVTSHRVNKVVKTLTIVTVLFLPLSFIAGLYGMNFEYMPELKIKYAYFYAIGFMVLIEILLIIILKRLKWF